MTTTAMLTKRVAAQARASYSTATGASAPRRRAVLPRLVAYAAVGAAVFYGGSVEASRHSEAYRDFFTQNVYGGKELVSYFSQHALSDIPDDLKRIDVDEQVSWAAQQVRDGFQHLSRYVQSNEHVQHTREEVEKRTAELQQKLQAQLEELRTKAEKESAHLYEQAQSVAGRSLSDAREHLEHLTHGRTEEAEAREPAGAEAPSPADEPTSMPLYAERKLVADRRPTGRLRDDPEAPRLPQLAASLKKQSSSEPVIAQLAGTIDELAAFLRDAPHAGALARGVLTTAQSDLEKLCQRLDDIKASDAQKLDAQLEKQAQGFEAELKKAAEKAASELGQRDADWSKKVQALQDEQARQFKTHLAKELQVQSEIIDERLRDEVIARGIELQRKWSNEIKAKVEQERAGRLARLDELAKELQGIEGMLFANADTLDDSFQLNSLHAALRTLRAAIDGPSAADASPYVRRTFANELATLRSKAKSNEVIEAALRAVDETGAASEGVESVPTLHEWFRARVAPRLTQVALLPEQGAGVLSYVASVVLSPLLLARQGLVPGTDVSSIVARAEWLLDHRDLDAAARELNQLRGWAKLIASDWLHAARQRLEVDQALHLVEQEASFASLLHT